MIEIHEEVTKQPFFEVRLEEDAGPIYPVEFHKPVSRREVNEPHL